MKLQTDAAQVANRTALLLQKSIRRNNQKVHIIQEPVWFRIVAANPPSQHMVFKAKNLDKYVNQMPRNQIGGLNNGKYITRNKNPGGYRVNAKHLYRPKHIKYDEDEIRLLFYRQHPWEKARPRLMVENSGNDKLNQDWSSIIQLNKPLDSESVVQRTLWLWNQAKKDQATGDNAAPGQSRISWLPYYDQARLEFYRLRMREEAEIKVAVEEASMFGGVFGKSAIEQGIEEEQRQIDKWEVDAVDATQLRRSKMTASDTLGSYGQEPEGEEGSTTEVTGAAVGGA